MIKDETIILDQCLYGYSEGHRLLSSSVTLDEKSQNELLRKSDIPSGINSLSNEHYYTGFPLINAKVYALIKTWFAPEMNRPGCVWSHILLIRFSDFDKIQDFSSLEVLFRRPENDFDYYSSKLHTITNEDGKPQLKFEGNKFSQVLNAIYSSGIENKEISTSSPESYINEIYSAWSIQWPKLRRSFRFTIISQSTSSKNDTLKTNDIVFVVDKNEKLDNLIIEEWQEKLKYWLNKEPCVLKCFLWDLGRIIKGGRQKFINLIDIFDTIKRNDKFKNKLEIDSLMQKIKYTFTMDEERIYCLDYTYGFGLLDNQNTINFAASILTSFDYNELYVPDGIKERITESIINLSIHKDNLSCLLTDEMVSSGNSITSMLLGHITLTDLSLFTYSLRSLSEICSANDAFILNDYFWSLNRRECLYILNTNWHKVSTNTKSLFIKRTISFNNSDFMLFIIKKDEALLLSELLKNRLIFDCDVKNNNTHILTSLILNNIILSQEIASSYNVINDLLVLFDYNEYILNEIKIDIIEQSITNHLSELENKDKFNYFSFVYFKTYNEKTIKQTHLLFYSFTVIHDFLSNNISSEKGWNMLQKVLPRVSMFKSWDKCYVLRKSLILYCNKRSDENINLNSLLRGHDSLRKLQEDLNNNSDWVD